MPLLDRNLDLRQPDDRTELLRILATTDMVLEPEALEFALAHLTEDWHQLYTLDMCSLKSSPSSYAIPLSEWVAALQGLYEFRHHKNIDTQIHHLRTVSHEKVDTILAITVARRYKRRGFHVQFDPNGAASTDLLLERDLFRLYAEVKRENFQEHKRHQRMLSLGGQVNNRALAVMKPWLRENNRRIELKLSRHFSDDLVERIVSEVEAIAHVTEPGVENQLRSLPSSMMILLPRQAEFFYKKGVHSSVITVETAGVAVSLGAPENHFVRCTFTPRLNLDALGQRIRKASKQLKRDLDKDPQAAGFIVTEFPMGGEEAVTAVQERFWNRLDPRCWGVALLPSCVIPCSDLTPDQLEILTYAGLEPGK